MRRKLINQALACKGDHMQTPSCSLERDLLMIFNRILYAIYEQIQSDRKSCFRVFQTHMNQGEISCTKASPFGFHEKPMPCGAISLS